MNYSSEELPAMLGRTTGEIADSLGEGYEKAVVHIDDLALMDVGQ